MRGSPDFASAHPDYKSAEAFAGTGIGTLLTLPTRRRTAAALSPRLPMTFPTSQLGATRERLLYFSASVEHSSLSA